MAILLDIAKSSIGVPITGAYFRLCSANICRTLDLENRFVVQLDVFGYATNPGNDPDINNVAFVRFQAPLTEIEEQPDAGFLAKCYAWLSNQPEMAGCKAV